MPYDVSTFILPCGVQATRADGSGVIDKEAADALLQLIGPGRPYFGQPLLVSTRHISKLTSEARSLLSVHAPEGVQEPWCAVVVTSPVIRVTVNFLLRVAKTTYVKVFAGEPEALAWLDERAREDAARKAGAT